MPQPSGSSTWVARGPRFEQRMLDEVWDRELAMHLRHTIDKVGLEMQVVRKCHMTVFSGVCAEIPGPGQARTQL